MDITIKETLIRTLWAEHWPAQYEAVINDMKAAGYDPADKHAQLTFAEDKVSAIMYLDGDAIALVTIDYSEPCLKITYVPND